MEIKVKYKVNDLNKKIAIQQVQDIIKEDELGREKTSREWVKIREIWGKLEIVSSNIITTHGVIESKNNYNVILRNSVNVNKDNRFIYKNLILYIKNIDYIDKYYLKITCEEIN